jgi:hypothetical protein
MVKPLCIDFLDRQTRAVFIVFTEMRNAARQWGRMTDLSRQSLRSPVPLLRDSRCTCSRLAILFLPHAVNIATAVTMDTA